MRRPVKNTGPRVRPFSSRSSRRAVVVRHMMMSAATPLRRTFPLGRRRAAWIGPARSGDRRLTRTQQPARLQQLAIGERIGGRHRSVGLARRVAELLELSGRWAVEVEHRDVDKPLLPAGAHSGR